MLELVTRNLKEVITVEELKKVMEKDEKKAYIGFEPSGFVHLGWLMCGEKVKDLVNAGFDVTILLADWHAWINDKLNGNMDAIRTCGEYIKDAFAAMGVKGVRYIYASDIVKDVNYWNLILKIAKATSLARVRRAMDIMGRKAEEAEKDFSKFIYPIMQVADIFYLGVDAALGGMDQRHAHMLARDFADKAKMKKPVALHTPIISSLKAKGRMDVAKMSKSKPGSAIFVHDEKEEIERKIKKAYCPEGDPSNPVMEIAAYLLFPHFGSIEINGKEYESYDTLEKDFVSKSLHPLDLKMGVASYLNKMIEPIRDYFKQNPKNLDMLKNYMNK
ncbi:MAG: tyrosine--tRNA ligase [Thermoplasmata archaeon]|nr:tyrosine--tRNA ligase [Thermoplasmata archaeon]